MIKPKELYDRLLAAYGEPAWWSEDPMVILVESVLVQHTKWSKVREIVLDQPSLVRPEKLISLDREELVELIRPLGFHQAKSRTIQELMAWYQQYGFDPERVSRLDPARLRHELLSIRGIGAETADVILVYAFHKPSFIIDAYTRRLLQRLGLTLPDDAAIRRYFEEGLPRDHRIYGSFHWLILEHCIQVCRKTPLCEVCTLKSNCRHGLVMLDGIDPGD